MLIMESVQVIQNNMMRRQIQHLEENNYQKLESCAIF
jgi:hypothetical protein